MLENRGLLYFDSGDMENADAQAAQAYALGKEEGDFILMARARILRRGVCRRKPLPCGRGMTSTEVFQEPSRVSEWVYRLARPCP